MVETVMHKYDLRCVLVYANGKTWASQWNRSNVDDPTTCASMQPRDGLLYAAIQGKEKRTKELSILATCKAEDFLQFRWVGAVRAPGMGFGTIKRFPTVIGLTIVERWQEVSVMRSGKMEQKIKTFGIRG